MLSPTKQKLPLGARRQMAHMLTVFSDSGFMFHLAGSYYFGVASEDSDVDLYAEYKPALLTWLRDNGFRRLGIGGRPMLIDIEQENYVAIEKREGDTTHGVFEHATSKLHVQVFYNLDVALRARDILAKCFNAEHARTRGEDRSRMWRAALDAAQVILDAATAA